MNYERDLAIDPDDLAEEWLRHPALFLKYADLQAEAQRKRDLLKEKLDVTKAELDIAIRKNPGDYDLSKVTESAISNVILTDPTYRAAAQELIEANRELALIQAAVRAFEHRKKALESLVQLHAAKWFAGPQEPKTLAPGKRMADAAEENATRKQREAINRNRRRKRMGK